MQLKIIGTGSAGNCYLLENEHEALLIECGVRFEKVKQAIDFEIDKIAGCIVTHEHGDHFNFRKQVLDSGIEMYASKGTYKAFGINHHRANVISHGKQFQVGGFKILPFNVHHDVNEPLGFLIDHNGCGKTLFLTDTTHCDYVFKDLNNIIIEANFCNEILKEKFPDNHKMKFLSDRVLQSHMSIDTCKKTLLANDLSKVNNIVLIHLSDGNSHEENFKRTILEATGRTVHVANNNQILEFNKTPF